MHLVLHGVEDFRVGQSDTLPNPGSPMRLAAVGTESDYINADTPLLLQEWVARFGRPTPWARPAFGLPPASCGHSTWANERDMLK